MKKRLYGSLFGIFLVVAALGVGTYSMSVADKPTIVDNNDEIPSPVDGFTHDQQVSSDTIKKVGRTNNIVQIASTSDSHTSAALYGTDNLAENSKLDYGEVKNIYDYRFQISDCRAIVALPSYGSLNVKQGASIVLENHDSVPHVLAIGTQAYNVSGADYVVMSAPQVEKPVGYLVTCDGKGAGALYVYP